MNIDEKQLAEYLAYTEVQIYFDFKQERIYEVKEDPSDNTPPVYTQAAQKIYDTCITHYLGIIETFKINEQQTN